MPRYGLWGRVAGERIHFQFNCKKSELPETCALCGFIADVLCDYPAGEGKTCDMPLCEKCRVNIGHELDYCPSHAEKWRRYRESGELAQDLVRQRPQAIKK